MPDLLKWFFGFLVGFFLYELLDALLGSDAFDAGAAALDSVVTAAIATIIVVIVQRIRGRNAAPRDAA